MRNAPEVQIKAATELPFRATLTQPRIIHKQVQVYWFLWALGNSPGWEERTDGGQRQELRKSEVDIQAPGERRCKEQEGGPPCPQWHGRLSTGNGAQPLGMAGLAL